MYMAIGGLAHSKVPTALGLASLNETLNPNPKPSSTLASLQIASMDAF